MTRMSYPKVTLKQAKQRFHGKLTYRERQELPDNAFAIPHERKYPVYNQKHARNALARVSRFGTDYEKVMICKAVATRYPMIHAQSCKLDHGSFSAQSGHNIIR